MGPSSTLSTHLLPLLYLPNHTITHTLKKSIPHPLPHPPNYPNLNSFTQPLIYTTTFPPPFSPTQSLAPLTQQQIQVTTTPSLLYFNHSIIPSWLTWHHTHSLHNLYTTQSHTQAHTHSFTIHTLPHPSSTKQMLNHSVDSHPITQSGTQPASSHSPTTPMTNQPLTDPSMTLPGPPPQTPTLNQHSHPTHTDNTHPKHLDSTSNEWAFSVRTQSIRGPSYKPGLTLIPEWISNHICYKVWVEIT